MFPLNDFNIVCAALATVSAAVGYNVHRRRRSSSLQARSTETKRPVRPRSSSVFSTYSDSCASSSTLDSDISMTDPVDCPTPSDRSNAFEEMQPLNLKRKSRDYDDDDSPEDHAREASADRESHAPAPSKKRCLTPSASDETEPYIRLGYTDSMAVVETEDIIVDEPIYGQVVPSEHVAEQATAGQILAEQVVVEDVNVATEQPYASVVVAITPEPAQPAKTELALGSAIAAPQEAAPASLELLHAPAESTEVSADATPSSKSKDVPAEVTAEVLPPSTPVKSHQPKEQTKPAIFRSMQPITPAKASSAFKAFASNHSAFTSTSASPGGRPVWASAITVDVFSPNGKAVPAVPSLGDREDGELVEDATQAGADGEAVWRPRTISGENPLAATTYTRSTHTTITGEEDEEVCEEIKGAKMYIMRGAGEFSAGTIGNAKILRHKETGDERILFRRDLVWKVAMNVKLSPAVRCTFNETSGELRFVLKEADSVTVYAMKRGQVPKESFAKFAQEVVANTHLQSTGKTAETTTT